MKTLKILLLILIIFLIGTFGYVTIEGWEVFDAFYMTAISITTVGFGETRPLSQAGKIFTILIIFTGLGAAAVFATHLARAFLENHFRSFFGESKMLKKINRLKDHYIICGYGGVGSAICSTLDDAGIKFVVIEEKEEVAKWAQKRNYFTVIGKATYDATLLQAGIKNATGIVVSMGDDSLNMYVSLAARELNPEIFIIARGYKSDIESRLLRAGANTVVYPIKMGGQQIANLIKKQLHNSDTDESNEGLSASVMGYSLRMYKHYSEDPSTILEIKKRMNSVNAVSFKKHGNDDIPNPSDDTVVNQDDSLVLVVESLKKEEETVKEDSLFYWRDEYKLGFDQMDEEHKKLFHITDEFVVAVKSGADREIVKKSYKKLVEYTIEHFENEEKLLTQYNYPDKDEHIRNHKDLTSKVMDLNKSRDYVFSVNVEDFLYSWLKDHIMDDDKEIVSYIHDNFNI